MRCVGPCIRRWKTSKAVFVSQQQQSLLASNNNVANLASHINPLFNLLALNPLKDTRVRLCVRVWEQTRVCVSMYESVRLSGCVCACLYVCVRVRLVSFNSASAGRKEN